MQIILIMIIVGIVVNITIAYFTANVAYAFCYGSKKTINKDEKSRLLLVPLIFMVLLHIPVMIEDIAYEFIQESPEVIRAIFILILFIPVMIWGCTFYYIPLGVYIAMLAVYTVVSWTWILRQKKGNVMYFIVWLVLCVLSILLYWKLEPQYYIMLNG